ncbi:hypothetical protein EHP00_170 [Ecytonucleospora hepatopenaei]|uniref:Uncharacterized protein n=1 Tax=Ecytonucleospora hepatopenaei TaxID=646526 RepID=A0A1W0E6E6_9MICR|nr:hypothetical protein EHP00_170 [Ecytonucleospora hepatopenaei]
MNFLITKISAVLCSFYYTIQVASEPSKKLCLTKSKAVFMQIEDPAEIKTNCQFEFGDKKFKSKNGLFLCRSNNLNVFMSCLLKDSLNSRLEILNVDKSQILQQGTMKMILGEYDGDAEGYTAEAIENPSGNKEKLKIVKWNAAEHSIIESEEGALEENLHVSLK